MPFGSLISGYAPPDPPPAGGGPVDPPVHCPPGTIRIGNRVGVDYKGLASFSEEVTALSQGQVFYQLSHDGVHWNHFNGSTWAPAFYPDQSNEAAEVGSRLPTYDFDLENRGGTFFFRAYLVSREALEPIEIRTVSFNGH